MPPKLLTRGLLAGAVVVAGEMAYVARRPLPRFDGFDPSGAFGDPDAPLLRIAVLGDSTITGPGLGSVDETFVRILARRLAERYRVQLTSQAVGGARSFDVLTLQLPEALADRPHLAFVSVGSNDILHGIPIPWFERRLDEIVRRLVESGVAVVLMGIGDLGTIPRFPAPLDRVASATGRIADRVQARVGERHGVAKVDHWGASADVFRSGTHMFAGDLFHPSAEGHRVWADTVYPFIEQALAGTSLRPTID
ncbi:MAG: SGNH/GDSL hydrolase family protein [Acidimicrobiia bacterium]